VSRYQKGKINLDFTEARDSEWQWHQLGRMQVCTSLQTDNHASTPPLKFFTGRMPFLPPNQQRQSTESINTEGTGRRIMQKNCTLQYLRLFQTLSREPLSERLYTTVQLRDICPASSRRTPEIHIFSQL